MKLFSGCAVALATPFRSDGSVDYPALTRLVETQLDGGVSALVACGTTGEPATLTDEEWSGVVAHVVRTASGRVPVIAGTGGNNTRAVMEKAQAARELGADAQLCVTPYYNKTSQAGVLEHFKAIAAGPLPVIVYNVPSRTGMTLQLDTVRALSGVPGVIGLKDASGDAALAADVLSACGDDLPLYSGADELTCQLRVMGASGCISVLSNVAPRSASLIAGGELSEAAREQKRMMPLIRLLFREVSPIPLKAALHMMGICENVLRLPLVRASAQTEDLLKEKLKELELI